MTTICQIFNTFKKFSQEMVADAAKPLNKKTNIKSSSEKEEPVVLINEDMFETDSESEEENVEVEAVEEKEEDIESVEEEEEDIESVEEKEEEEALEENIEEEEALEENVEEEEEALEENIEEEEEEEKVSEYEEDDEYDEDNEYHEDDQEESEDDQEESEESEDEQEQDDEPIPESHPYQRDGTQEIKKPVKKISGIKLYDTFEMRLGGERWRIRCVDTEGVGAFEVIDAPYRQDIEGYIFRKGDRYGGLRPVRSPINFIFQLLVENVGLRRQSRSPWSCIYKWKDGVYTHICVM
jgi:hypothetical protein